MSEAQDQILKMLEEGKITAEEADKLLAVLGPEQNVGTGGGDVVVTGMPEYEASETQTKPIIIDIDDDDGDKVEIYIG